MYTFPTDTKYEGELLDGMFHGQGTLFFPNGSKFVGRWEKGIAVEVCLYYRTAVVFRMFLLCLNNFQHTLFALSQVTLLMASEIVWIDIICNVGSSNKSNDFFRL